MSAVVVGLLFGEAVTMMIVALKWPLRALEPVLPLSLVFAAALLAAERLLVHNMTCR